MLTQQNYPIYSDFVSKHLAVTGSDIVLDFGSPVKPQIVLNNLSVNIPQGCIYGLIGPSGSGKTSLQRAITGVYKINSGSLAVFGQSVSSKDSCVPGPLIGYMPQEIALDDELTAKELLIFLGRCAGLDKRLIHNKIDEILEVMQINDKNTRTVNFSVGQRRRLSLACTLIHSPKLLLLDEPTVGSDIVVVKKIWDYLRHLSDSQGATIVISTHYLEEVTKADYFGFMSNGQMLIEGRPKLFMESMGAVTFEEAILSTYYNSDKKMETSSVEKPLSPVKIADYDHEKPQSLSFLPIIFLLTLRYLKRWRVKLTVPYLCFVCIVFLNYSIVTDFYGVPPKGLALAFVDRSNSSIYLPLITSYLSSRHIQLTQVSDENHAAQLVETLTFEGYFVLPKNFDDFIESRVLNPFSFTIKGKSKDDLIGKLILYQDRTDAVKPGIIYLRLIEALTFTMENIARENGRPSGFDFMRIEPLIARTDDPDRMNSKPILIIRVYTFCMEVYSMILLSYWSVNEAREPMTERLISLGVTQNYLSIALISLATFFLTPTFLVTLVWARVFAGLPMLGNWFLVILMTPAFILCGLSKAVLFGTLARNSSECIMFTMLYTVMAWLFSCVLWPYEAFVYFLQPYTSLFPHLIPGNALIRIMVYGDGLENPKVMLGMIYIFAFAFIHLIAVFKFTVK